jgi:hypothetical protein
MTKPKYHRGQVIFYIDGYYKIEDFDTEDGRTTAVLTIPGGTGVYVTYLSQIRSLTKRERG